jgi:hypothetical protein
MIPWWIIIISFIIWFVSFLLTLSKFDSALSNFDSALNGNLPFEERNKFTWFVFSFIIYKLSGILNVGMISWNLIIILCVTTRDMT